MSLPLIAAIYESTALLHERGLSATDRSILLALANRMNSESLRCDPSYQTIAKDIGRNEKTVRRRVPFIESTGLLGCTTRTRTSKSYEIPHIVDPANSKRRVLTPHPTTDIVSQKVVAKSGSTTDIDDIDYGHCVPTTTDIVSTTTDIVSPKPGNHELKPGKEPELNLLSGQVGQVGSVSPSQSGLPGERRGTVTNPMEVQARRQQQAKTKAPVATPPATPVGPTHALAVKFLDNVGATLALKKKGLAWDQIAAELARTYPLDDLLAAVDWVWANGTDPFWATQFAKSFDDPFKFFALKAEKILDRHQRLLTSQAQEAKRNSNKENSNDSNNDNADYDPISTW
jgi:hypothetical protein